MKKHLPLFILLILAFIPMLDFFYPGLPLTHDGQDHVARIASFYQSLVEGNLIPRWAGNLNWGYGHPILMFLYPLSSYTASFFHILGLDLVNSIKVVFVISFVFSGLSMYLWISSLWGRKAGLVSGLLYMFAPYHFVDIYVRGAIGENLAFVWPPLICYFAYTLSKKVKYRHLLGLALSFAALILSHNALSIMFFLPIIGYMVFLVIESNNKKLTAFCFLLSSIIGLGLSAFFWIPAYFEGKYTLRDIVTKNNITGFVENIQRLIWFPWSYDGADNIPVQLGIMQWIIILISPLVIWFFRRKKMSFWKFLVFLLFIFWVSIFMILPVSRPLYNVFPALQKLQFSWRFLSLAIFTPAIFVGALIYLFPDRIGTLFTSIIVIGILLLNKNYWHAQSYLYQNESFYQGIYNGTTDTGESAPRWSVRFMEKRPKSHIEVIDGQANIKEIKRNTNEHQYEINTTTKTRIRENTLYFPGWQVLIDNQPSAIEFQDEHNRGLITFFVKPGKHVVTVKFGETKLRLVSDIISFMSLLFLIGTFFFKKRILNISK
ncbi:MAG: 6-pyruvoyl-tetrahydropterin synthase-related protein [Candidatus Gottesmanbacteria bacterium]